MFRYLHALARDSEAVLSTLMHGFRIRGELWPANLSQTSFCYRDILIKLLCVLFCSVADEWMLTAVWACASSLRTRCSVLDLSEGKDTCLYKRPLVSDHLFFSQPDTFVLSKFLLVSGSWIFRMCISYLTTTDVEEGEAYGQADPERNSPSGLLQGAVTQRGLTQY